MNSYVMIYTMTMITFLLLSVVGTPVLYLNDLNEFPIHTLKDNSIIVIDSPGGSMVVGNAIVEKINKYKNITCVCRKAHSMSAYIFQSCHYRISGHGSVLMFHRARIGRGIINNIDLEIAQIAIKIAIILELKYMNKVADILDMELEDFKEQIRENWYIYGSDIYTLGLSDLVIGFF